MDEPGSRPRHKSETFEITIAGLLTKRADTFGELLRLRERETELEANLVAMDRVLAAFGYQGDLEAVPPRAVRDAPFGRGQVMRAILNHMRTAGEPLTARQITEGAFGHLASEECENPVPIDSLARRVSKALGRLNRDGAVDRVGDGFGGVVWSLEARR